MIVPAHQPLGELLADIPAAWRGIVVSGLSLDSRQVEPGHLFLAYPGAARDGRDFIDQAIARGAIAVIAEAGMRVESRTSVPVIERTQLLHQLSAIAGRFYGRPSADIHVIGVTGTNGKTSCTHIIGQMLRLLGNKCGVCGTLGAALDGTVQSGSLTTPDAIFLQRLLADWRQRGVHYAALEVSSHGLAQGRVADLAFQAAVFTNLTRDHLDYHGDMATYAAEKFKLFKQPGLKFAVINSDDDSGRQLARQVDANVRCYRFSLRDDGADIFCRDISHHRNGFDVVLSTPWGETHVHAPLLGEFNLSNMLAAIGVLGGLDFPLVDIAKAAAKVQAVAGRMQQLPNAAGIDVIVDYAHTPDALEKVLAALRHHCQGKLWCVFGCGGDRDRGKRALMGSIAERLADHVVVTSDNPRSEEPQHIINDIINGMSRAPFSCSDRAAAIQHAIGNAQRGDLVVIAGKGHETYQVIGGERLPFSDVNVAQKALAARGEQ